MDKLSETSGKIPRDPPSLGLNPGSVGVELLLLRFSLIHCDPKTLSFITWK
jgi:hypothetical protein